MKRLLCTLIVLAVCMAAKAFVVKVSDIPEAVMNHPISIVSCLDDETLDSIQPQSNNVVLNGTLDKAVFCKLTYSFDIPGGVRTNSIPLFLGLENDTVNCRLTENFENGGVVVSGVELNNKRDTIWTNMASLKGNERVEYIRKHAMENITNPLGVFLVSMLSSSLDPNIWMGLYHEMPADMAKAPSHKK